MFARLRTACSVALVVVLAVTQALGRGSSAALAQSQPAKTPVLRGGVHVNVYPPLDPRNYPDEDPLKVRPVGMPAAGGARCTPPDPTWRLLAQDGDQCLYAAPLSPQQQQSLRGFVVMEASEAQASGAGPCSVDPWDDEKLVCRPGSRRGAQPPPEQPPSSGGGNVVAIAAQVQAYVNSVADSGGVHCGSDYAPCRQFTKLIGLLSAEQKTLPHAWPVQCYDEMMGAWQSAQRGLRQQTHQQSQASVDCYRGVTNVAGPTRRFNQCTKTAASVVLPALVAMNDAIDRIPGLSGALQNGSAITKQMADEIKADYDITKSPYAGLHLLRDALLEKVGSKATEQLGGLLAKALPIAEKRLAKLVVLAQAELETEATQTVEGCVKATTRIRELTNPERIKLLTDQERGANARVKKILYWMYAIDHNGGDVRATLWSALKPHIGPNGYTPKQAALVLNNVLDNYRGAQRAAVFSPLNRALLRLGLAPLAVSRTGQIFVYDVDHLIPLKVAPEIATSLANLRLTPAPLNRAVQETISAEVVDLAVKFNRAGLLSKQGLSNVLKQYGKQVPMG